jgi:hypothetical protein
MFEARRRHQLHADANAEKRASGADHALLQRLDHAVQRRQPAPAVAERADARQNDAIGTAHRFRH